MAFALDGDEFSRNAIVAIDVFECADRFKEFQSHGLPICFVEPFDRERDWTTKKDRVHELGIGGEVEDFGVTMFGDAFNSGVTKLMGKSTGCSGSEK